MESIDKLKEVINRDSSYGCIESRTKRELLDWAIRIEREHDESMREQATTIWEHVATHYIQLPLDAENQPWHVGDNAEGVTKWPGERFVIGSIEYDGDEWLIIDAETSDYIPADAAKRVEPDTWEQIIKDALAYKGLPTDVDMQLLVDRCKALAGDKA
jgi:hypothetical protein